MNEKFVIREEFNNAIADEAAQSCVDWSNPERRKEALRYIVKQIWDEARGPVGGAGELTAAVSEVRDRLWEEARRGPEYGYLGNLGDTLNAALDAKAPHHRWPRIRHAAKAPQGVPACEYCEALWERDEKTMKHRHPSVAGFGAFAYKCTAAPSAPSLPVPGPVSDTTIHHGMFPPAPSGATTTECICNSGFGMNLSCPVHKPREAAIARPFYRELREALAAAPSAPTNNSFDLGAAVKNLHDLQKVGAAMGLHTPPTDVESLAATFHDIYQQEAKRQGDVRHKDAYADLPDNVKEFDRVLARYVLANFGDAASAERVRPLRDGLERLTKATANFTGSQRSKERVKEALRVAMEILTDDDKKLAGALPPSTGEKQP